MDACIAFRVQCGPGGDRTDRDGTVMDKQPAAFASSETNADGELERRSSSLGVDATLAQAGKKYARTFLFSINVQSAVARLHIASRIALAIGASVAVLIMMRSDHLDPLGIALLGALALFEMYLAGVLRWVLHTYALAIPIMMVSLGVSWVLFNPVHGSMVLLDVPVYSGVLSVGLAPWEGALLVSAVLVWRVRRSALVGLLVGLGVGWTISVVVPGPVWEVASFPFFTPLRLFVSDLTVYTAATKVLGFGVTILIVLGLFMMMRGIEVVGFLNQLRLPFKASFFVALALRSLSTAIEDYDTIRQAQVARGSGVAQKGTVQQIRDFGMMAVPLIATSLTRSTQMAAALAARGFATARHPTPYRDTRPIRAVDALVGVGALVFPVLLLLSNFNVTGVVGAIGGAL